MEKLKDVCELKHELIEAVKHEIEEKGIYNPELRTEEVGMVVDMIKDLAQVEKDCMEACYYESVVEAMGGELEGRSGYDHWRYASGRYAPKGHGHYSSGYTQHPPVYMNDRMMPQTGMDDYYGRMGYPAMTKNQSGSRTTYSAGYPMSRHGESYNNYVDARRHYHDSHDANDKAVMNHHAEEHLDDTIESLKDIWVNADPEFKKKMKGNMSKFVAELAV